jgi:hypothetical protein
MFGLTSVFLCVKISTVVPLTSTSIRSKSSGIVYL